MAIKQRTRALRHASTASATIGVFVNIITLVVLRNQAILNDERVFKHGIRPSLLVIADLCGFLGFLAILIGNGILVNGIISGGGLGDNVQMLVYNTMPWIISGGIHLILALQDVVDIFGLEMPKRQTRCVDCKCVMSQNQGKSTDDGASRSLLQPDYDSEEDGETNA